MNSVKIKAPFYTKKRVKIYCQNDYVPDW